LNSTGEKGASTKTPPSTSPTRRGKGTQFSLPKTQKKKNRAFEERKGGGRFLQSNKQKLVVEYVVGGGKGVSEMINGNRKKTALNFKFQHPKGGGRKKSRSSSSGGKTRRRKGGP